MTCQKCVSVDELAIVVWSTRELGGVCMYRWTWVVNDHPVFVISRSLGMYRKRVCTILDYPNTTAYVCVYVYVFLFSKVCCCMSYRLGTGYVTHGQGLMLIYTFWHTFIWQVQHLGHIRNVSQLLVQPSSLFPLFSDLHFHSPAGRFFFLP